VVGRSDEFGSCKRSMCFRLRVFCLVASIGEIKSIVSACEWLVSVAACVCSVAVCDDACMSFDVDCQSW
jgi:hypothetical protein